VFWAESGCVLVKGLGAGCRHRKECMHEKTNCCTGAFSLYRYRRERNFVIKEGWWRLTKVKANGLDNGRGSRQ
jgi:hypothetical protein